ncbi:MAG: threonylcarbamoyl-AMP synthase [Kofleriaceae bacterium]|jgi:L-threonylcarbamoyladenylate synthase|nr:threonylcarbamoyl-AMP synthase [Kofleriaceae bacterium]MBP9171164.1 threonylcarbamoyl-AMP synthase [Kofleriaceae bacterium]MBP9861899.1 threonylcarbamoyl-AMP synthase [Kofleriaceae bacterium]
MRLGADVAHAARVLADGGLVAFPTETVYGLGADATSAAAVERIYQAKGRPRTHPVIVHLASYDQLGEWVSELSDAARALAARFWPGPLTLIARRGPKVLDQVTGGAPTVGLRVPSHPMAQALLTQFGKGVAAPSANRFGSVSATTATHVVQDLGDLVDYILDGGACAIGVESTIVDVSGPHPALLRPGGVPREAIEAFLGRPLAAPTSTPAPGGLPSHYAPSARVVPVAPGDLGGACALAPGPVGALAPAAVLAAAALPPSISAIELPDDPAAMAARLYAALRDLDALGVRTIVAVVPDAVGLGEAIADRLHRAGGPRPAGGEYDD